MRESQVTYDLSNSSDSPQDLIYSLESVGYVLKARNLRKKWARSIFTSEGAFAGRIESRSRLVVLLNHEGGEELRNFMGNYGSGKNGSH